MSAPPRTLDAVKQELKELLVSNLSLENVTAADIQDDTPLFGEGGLGLDSLDALEVILGIEQEFGVKVEEGNISVLRSINTIVDHLLERNVALRAAR